MSKHQNRTRKALLRNLANSITVLVAHDDVDALREVLETTGYINLRSVTSDEAGRAAFALAQVIGDIDDLASVVHNASFRVALVGVLLDDLDAATRATRWELAQHAAATTLSDCGRDLLERFVWRMNTPAEEFGTSVPTLQVVNSGPGMSTLRVVNSRSSAKSCVTGPSFSSTAAGTESRSTSARTSHAEKPRPLRGVS